MVTIKRINAAGVPISGKRYIRPGKARGSFWLAADVCYYIFTV